MSNVRKFRPGQAVRVEFNAQIVGLANPDNPYFYIVEFHDGHRETVSLSRLNAVVERVYATFDHEDGTVETLSRRMSASAALDLLLWLQLHRSELEALLPPDAECPHGWPPDGSTEHDHLCRCPGCNPHEPPEPPDLPADEEAARDERAKKFL